MAGHENLNSQVFDSLGSWPCSGRALVLNLGATAPYGALLTFRGAEILRGRYRGRYIQKV